MFFLFQSGVKFKMIFTVHYNLIFFLYTLIFSTVLIPIGRFMYEIKSFEIKFFYHLSMKSPSTLQNL